MPTRRSKVDAVGQVLVDLAHRRLHAEPGAHRALGVVLVRDRRAEDRHHVVADVLVDGAAVALDLLAEPHQHAVDSALTASGSMRSATGGVAGQVGEQDGDLAALLGQPLRPDAGAGAPACVERLAAVHAEARLGRRGRAAAGAAVLERSPAGHAEARPGGVLGPARRRSSSVEITRGRTRRAM